MEAEPGPGLAGVGPGQGLRWLGGSRSTQGPVFPEPGCWPRAISPGSLCPPPNSATPHPLQVGVGEDGSPETLPPWPGTPGTLSVSPRLGSHGSLRRTGLGEKLLRSLSPSTATVPAF